MDPQRVALLIMDVQHGIVERVGSETLLARLIEATSAARKKHVRVIYVMAGFREGYPEVSPRNANFARIAEAERFVEGRPSSAVHEAIAPRRGDPVVTKRRVSAFSGTDLELLLRAAGTEALVLAGIATSGVVLSTLRQAADLDFALAVLSDACADADQEVHDVLMRKVFPHQAQVLTVGEWRAALGAS